MDKAHVFFMCWGVELPGISWRPRTRGPFVCMHSGSRGAGGNKQSVVLLFRVPFLRDQFNFLKNIMK